MEQKRTSIYENGLIWFGAGVSIAEIITGTYFAPLGFGKGLLAVIIGHIIGCTMLFLAGLIGGRTRKIGTLLGRGLTFDEAMEELKGVTLESIVIATRTARAVKKLAARGVVKLDDYPLLMHVDSIINEGAPVNIPWEKFTMVVE